MQTVAIRNLSLALVASLSVGASPFTVPAVAAIAKVKQETPSKPRVTPESDPPAKPQVAPQSTPAAKPQAEPQSAPTPQPDSCRRIKTSDGASLNVRATPGGNIVGTLPDRSLVTIVNLGANGWVPISSPQTGYVFASYLSPCTTPIPDERPNPTSSCRRIAAKEGMAVRQNPSLNSVVLGTLIDGQEITIMNRGANGWVPISSPINGYVLSVGLVMCPN